jgi:hypothetical protein
VSLKLVPILKIDCTLGPRDGEFPINFLSRSKSEFSCVLRLSEVIHGEPSTVSISFET